MGTPRNTRQRLETLDSLLEASMEAFFRIDARGHLLEVNRQAETLCHKTRTELLGTRIADAFSLFADELFALKARQAREQHQPLTYTTFSPVLNSRVLIRLSPLRTGLAISLQTFSPDQQGEPESIATAQAVLNSLNDTIAVVDPDGTIVAVNEAWRSMARQSCPPERLGRTGVGMNYLQICRDAQGISAQQAKEAGHGIEAVLAGTRSSFTLEYPCFSPTRQSWYLMHVTPLAPNKGAVVIHIDITERKHQELALREATRRFDAFLSTARHELKTPLAGIRGTIELVLRRLEKMTHEGGELSGAESQTLQRLQHPLEQAKERVIVQSGMLTDWLDASRISADRMEIVTHLSNLIEIVRHVVGDVQALVPNRTFHVHLPEMDNIPVIVDNDRITQILANYLTNAVKYSIADKPVEISLIRDASTAQVSVKDQGPGLTPDEQVLVWERFHPVIGVETHVLTPAEQELSLYLCRTIIELHAGRVGVNSIKGEGSTFWFTLPLAPEP